MLERFRRTEIDEAKVCGELRLPHNALQSPGGADQSAGWNDWVDDAMQTRAHGLVVVDHGQLGNQPWRRPEAGECFGKGAAALRRAIDHTESIGEGSVGVGIVETIAEGAVWASECPVRRSEGIRMAPRQPKEMFRGWDGFEVSHRH